MNGTGPAVPVYRVQDLTPFGEYFGNITQSYLTFTPSVPPASAFTVNLASSCEEGDPDTQCSNDAMVKMGLHLLPGFDWLRMSRMFSHRSNEAALASNAPVSRG